MNADEIVNTLRNDIQILTTTEHIKDGEPQEENLVLKILKRHLADAADLIESLTAENARLKIRDKTAKYHVYKDKWADAQIKLAASQRRERAAVEDLKAVLVEGGYGCDYCKHERIQLDCAPSCSNETKLGGWQWRGPQEAGKAKQMIKKGDRVIIRGSAEEENYKGCMFEVLSDPYEICGSMVVKMKCHETGKYFGGGYAVAFLVKA